ncbi:metallo beta-lactamase domain protein [Heliomicrobium modesticaldum Ice1]|uniref:Metallo beta-lactamase domain protein n=1 Tax=Heliobacterium modesticaldum (strain ATCC 51547 / Ice1) TaxID=498761 RepID=B0TI49_HELMI|nr:metallo beta-lactamase domain protein [Heliomicrobium modesticaldum Ice1]
MKPLFLCLLVFTLALTGCSKPSPSAKIPGSGEAPSTATTQATSVQEVLRVHFIDVGQADSILIQSPAGRFVLVDGGNIDDGQQVVDYLKRQGVKELAAIVATHPHEDHIGGLDKVLRSFPVGQVYMPKATTTTKTFAYFLNAVKSSGAKRVEAKGGVKLDVPDMDGTFLAPNGTDYEEMNDYSAVLKVTYGKISFLLMGDAEAKSEAEMLARGYDLKADVLKVGHHGSSSSTTSPFLKAVSPRYAFIPVGDGNDYGHPHKKTLDKLAKAGVEVFRADKNGTVVATCDGNKVSFEPEKR